MLDNAEKWPPEPDWPTAVLRGEGVEARGVSGLTQLLVSGDLGAFGQRHGLAAPLGGLGLARGDRYALRLARDRIAVVGVTETSGWRPEGYAVTPISAGWHVLELRGPALLDLVARATQIDARHPGPSAAVVFAGVTACLYFHEDHETLRLHFDRGLASYMWTWLQSQPLFAQRPA